MSASVASGGFVERFSNLVLEDTAVPVAAMITMVEAIERSRATAFADLHRELEEITATLEGCDVTCLRGVTRLSLTSGCKLFIRYVTRINNKMMNADFSEFKSELIKRGKIFANMSQNSRNFIAKIGRSFFQENCTVLVHGFSRVVLALLKEAYNHTIFNIIVTEGRPRPDGGKLERVLREAGISTVCTVADSSVAVVMEQVDFCLVGAEAVVENGGVINQLGSFQVALVAKAMKKPFYVAVESYKFARNLYPLNQRDAADLCMSRPRSSSLSNLSPRPSHLPGHKQSFPSEHQFHIDYTPAENITLLFTDLGVLTPAAVSEELIKLYQ